MHSRVWLRTMPAVLALCMVLVCVFSLVGWFGIPTVQAGITPTSASPASTDTPAPSIETPKPTSKKTPVPALSPTPYPTPPPPPTFTPPAPPTPTAPILISVPKTGGGDGVGLSFGVWQIGLGLVLIGIAVAWGLRRRGG